MYDPMLLAGKSHEELIARRQEIVDSMAGKPMREASLETLEELAYIFKELRRKTSGPPKVAKTSKRSPGPKGTADDLAALLDL